MPRLPSTRARRSPSSSAPKQAMFTIFILGSWPNSCPNIFPAIRISSSKTCAGAAGLIGTNQVYNVAKPDGLTFGAIYPALYFEQLAKRPEAKFDWNKFIWIGSTINSNSLMYMRADTPYKTIEDVRTASTPPKCGATGVTSSAYYMPKLLEDAIRHEIRRCTRDMSPGRTLTWRWNAAKFSAAPLRSTRFSPASRSSPGARRISLTCSIRPAASAMKESRMCRCSVN